MDNRRVRGKRACANQSASDSIQGWLWGADRLVGSVDWVRFTCAPLNPGTPREIKKRRQVAREGDSDRDVRG